jgi:ABC-type spermidine/putrescine transport system permease subunit I
MGQARGRALFFVPALALLAIFVVYPVVNTVWLSFFTPEGEFALLKNYADVLSEPEMFDPRGFERGFPYGALIHNVIWIVLHLPLTVMLGLIFAVILRDVKGGAVVKSIVFLGMVTPMVVGGIILRFLFDGNVGIVPSVLALFGFTPRTLTAYPDTALFSLIAGSLWLWTPFSMVLYSAGLETIPDFVYEAAVIDGASPWRIFFNIRRGQNESYRTYSRADWINLGHVRSSRRAEMAYCSCLHSRAHCSLLRHGLPQVGWHHNAYYRCCRLDRWQGRLRMARRNSADRWDFRLVWPGRTRKLTAPQN